MPRCACCKPTVIAGLFADLDIGQQAEHGAAPIGASPAVGAVEAAVARLGQALLHVAQHVAPDLLRGELPGLDPGDRLDIGGKALGQPDMRRMHVGQRKMRHLMHGLPVVGEFGLVTSLPTKSRIAAPR